MSQEEKARNREISRVRVRVEHAIEGIKRMRILKDVFRLSRPGISNLVMLICCGLHNLRIACRGSQHATAPSLANLAA